MNEQLSIGEFPSYQPVLWKVFAVLARRGYFIAPEDARDVAHDFYLDGWTGLTQRFDPTRASPSTYVAAAFYRYARRRVLDDARLRRMLVDIATIEDLVSPDPGPVEQHEVSQRSRVLSLAITRLQRDERAAIYAYLASDQPSERTIAAHLGVTRYEARRRLATAIGQLSAALQEPTVGQATGSPLAGNTALGKPVLRPARVARPASRPSSGLGTLFNEPSTATHKVQEVSQVNLDTKARLLSHVFDAAPLAPDQARQLREALNTYLLTDDVVFTEEQARRLEQDPERLASLYDLLFEDSVEEPDFGVARAIEETAQAEDADIRAAFDMLLANLSDELRQRAIDAFARVPLEYLPVEPGCPDAPRADRVKLLLPELVASAMRALVLLFDAVKVEPRGGPPVSWTREQLRASHLRVETEAGEVHVPLSQAHAYIATSAQLPPESVAEFSSWIFAVVEVCPRFVRGYEYSSRRDGPTFLHRPRLEEYDLAALWCCAAAATARRHSDGLTISSQPGRRDGVPLA